MSYSTRVAGLLLGFALIATVVEASAVCPGISLAGEAFYADHRANTICLAANAQAGKQLTYSSIGEVYNNDTSGTTQAICNLPGIAGPVMKTAVAIVKKINGEQ